MMVENRCRWTADVRLRLWHILVFLLALTGAVQGVSSVDAFEFSNSDPSDDKRYIQGREQYEVLQKEAKFPKFSNCWLAALGELDNGCRYLTEDLQHRMTLAITNCFLLKTGRPNYECTRDTEISDCMKEMSVEAYNTYSTFFTHTQNICFFLQAQAWQESTENTITKLSESSSVVAEQMEDSSRLQKHLIDKQNASIKNQEMLLAHGNELKQSLEQSTLNVHEMLQEFKSSTSEQKALMFEVFDRVSALQNIVMGELTGFYSLIFYALSVTVSYLLTSTPRVSGARFWLFVLMTVNMVAERMLVYWGTSTQVGESIMNIDENSIIYIKLWWCRKFFTTLSFLVWLWVGYNYKDYNKVNNALLLDIQKQNSELKQYLQSNQTGVNSVPAINHQTQVAKSLMVGLDNTDHAMTVDVTHIKPGITPHSGYDSDSDVTSSSESGISDHTFHHTDYSDDSDTDHSYSTPTRLSRENTPALRDELEYLRASTPLREITPLRTNVERIQAAKREEKSSPRTPSKRRSRGTPQKPTNIVDECHYFLRSMRGKAPTVNNPVVETESAREFGKTVKHLAALATRNRRKAQTTMKRNMQALSSDEQ